MDWDKLRIFHAVAEAGSFTHAGERLNLSQSAISRQISALEESLGVILFHRHARGLLLTEQGEMLENAAHDIFSKMSQIEAALLDSKETAEGPLRITTTDFLGSTWLAPGIKKFIDTHPGLQLSLLFDDRILNLSMREADAAIRLYKPEQPDLIQRHLARINFHIYASKDYLAVNAPPKTVKGLKNHTLIGFPAHSPAPFTDPNLLFRMAGVDPDHDYNLLMLNSLYAIHHCVKTGAGMALLPDYLVADNHNLEVVLPDQDAPAIDMYFVYPEERRNSQRIMVFRDFLLDLVKTTPF